ncbi:hypothetical protein F2P56_019253 [Juglans regia]|uniref:Protein kinase domain-containing protein n=1 Tax=Juglans regia TaxID=51240 RepID=A0A833XBC6_JUGRE|nr:hypothetical protein F2P56_019253 [Juglans regia]
MVFEHVVNGSLQEKLYGTEREWPVLSCRRHMKIAFQLAQALQYLHDQCAPQIVHDEIKALNIILDEHLNCKLCNFGFAKMGFSSTVLPTSLPENENSLKKDDVYSFMVILWNRSWGWRPSARKGGNS